jgi:hypothetical protein
MQDSSLLNWWLTSRDAAPQPLRGSFDALVMLISWILWKERNRRTFEHTSLSSSELLHAVLVEAGAWITVGYRPLALLTALIE